MRQVQVARKRAEADGIVSFELVDPAGEALPPFCAGAHIDVHLDAGIGNGTLTRQYSLCNDPSERHRYLIAVMLAADSRGGSTAMHNHVHEGDLLTINDPRNLFQLASPSRHSLLLAGGIGITPILSMAQHLSAAHESFEIHYCTRSESRAAFRELIASKFPGAAHFHYDDGPAAQRLDAATLLAGQHLDTHLYICGPSGFLGHVTDTARTLGWNDANIHYEYFSPPPPQTRGCQEFVVRLAKSGLTVPVRADQSVMAALAGQDIQIPSSCEMGICGTCLTRVLEGEVDHQDSYLTPAEQARNDQFLPCCSRARTPVLVIDL